MQGGESGGQMLCCDMRHGYLATLGVLLIAACGGTRAASTTARTWPLAPIDTAAMLPTPSGLLIRDLAVGNGPLAREGSFVSVYYVGQLMEGTQFDAATPGDPPLRFQIGAHHVI